MSVRFLKGVFIAIDGFAFQDFEACTIGDIDDSPHIFIGEEDNADCLFTAAAFVQRTP